MIEDSFDKNRWAAKQIELEIGYEERLLIDEDLAELDDLLLMKKSKKRKQR